MKVKQLFISLALGLGLTLALLWLLGNPSTGLRAARAAAGDVYCVTHHGGTYAACTQVFTNVQAAVDAATGGEEIRVAAGTYTDVQWHAAPAGYNGPRDIKQLVYIDKTITICGGYTTTNWMTPDPVANPTILDAKEQGRVFYITGDISPRIEGLRITGGMPERKKEEDGGGVYVITAAATISNNLVFSNTARRGGGLFLSNSRPGTLLSGNIISANNVISHGGGVFLAQCSSVTLRGNEFISNTAQGAGGGLQLTESDAKLISNTIRDNKAGQGGGLRLSDYSSATLSFNDITFNTAITGGGLYLEDYSTATLSFNDISTNTAQHGGGLALHRHSEATLSDNTVISNTAHDGCGGGLRLTNYSTARLGDNTIISNNAAKEGGGLYLNLYSNATLSDNTVISSNTAHKFGGGLRLAYSSTATLSDTTIISNAAQQGSGLYLRNFCATTSTNTIIADNRLSMITGTGAGLHIEGSSAHLLHTTIARNSGGDGSGMYVTEFTTGTEKYYSTVALTNTILVSHREVDITVTGGNTVTVNGVLWYKTPITVSQAATAIVTVENQLEGDPAFAPDGYHLTTGSKAIDQVEEDGVTTDIDGDDRPFDGNRDGVAEFDIGADEFASAIEVIKKASATTASAGDIITYTYTVTNTGNMTLTGVIADDDQLGAINNLVTNTLAPDETTTGTATYTVQWSDLLPLGKSLVNTVTVTGTSRFGDVVTDTDRASIKLICPSLPVFGVLLLALLSVVLRRKE